MGELAEFNLQRLEVQEVGMWVLSIWAVSNILVNAFLVKGASGSRSHFLQMNIYWNIVNLILGAVGLRYALTADPASFDLATSVSEFHQMGKVLMVNAGLDVAYITGGFLMKEMAKSREKKHDVLLGYGKSLIFQGAFLLVFDIILFAILESKSSLLSALLLAN